MKLKSATLAVLTLSSWLSACSVNLSRFDVLNRIGVTNASKQITRADTADQGGADLSHPTGNAQHSLSQVTIGGSYLRSSAAGGGGDHKVHSGLHGDPLATQ